MIRDLKLGMKSLDFGHGLKGTCAIYVLFNIVGVLVIIFGESAEMGVLGDYILVCGSLFLTQLLYSLSVANMVQASPAKKRMQTSVPAVVNACCVLLEYLLFVLVRGIMAVGKGNMGDVLCNELFMVALLGVFIMIYIAVVYKCFIPATIMFFIVYVLAMNFLRTGSFYHVPIFGLGGMPCFYLLACVIGVALIIIGGFLAYLASLLVYKLPMSRLALPASLRREL